MRCPKCGGYRFDSDDKCLNCGYTIPVAKPPAWWASKDFQSPMSSDTPNSEGGESKDEHSPIYDNLTSNTPPELDICPCCKEKSFFWNENNHLYECLNRNCKYIAADKTPPELERCPYCNVKALFWNRYSHFYECLRCRRLFVRARDENGNPVKSSCPFCGKSDSLLYQEDLQSWECGSCLKTFVNPQELKGYRSMINETLSKNVPCYYHPDRESVDTCSDCGTKVCKFCKTMVNGKVYCPNCIEQIYNPGRRSFTKNEYKDRKEVVNKETNSKRSSYSHITGEVRWSWVFLILLLFVGIIFIIYTSNLLINHRINIYVGIGIIAASAVVILRNASVMKKRHWYKKTKSRRIIITIISLVLIASVMLAYAGIAPFSTARENLASLFNNDNQDSNATSLVTPTPIPTSQWTGANGETEHENVFSGGGIVIGGDGQHIELGNNPTAKNPTWNELKSFLLQDNTDKQSYIYPSFVCADFAEMLHNNAERQGIRAAYVLVGLSGYTDPYNYGISSNSGHALNAFNTTDMGLVYIDDTGLPSAEHYPCSADKKVAVSIGSKYIPISIFPCAGWSSTLDSMGTVTNVDIHW